MKHFTLYIIFSIIILFLHCTKESEPTLQDVYEMRRLKMPKFQEYPESTIIEFPCDTVIYRWYGKYPEVAPEMEPVVKKIYNNMFDFIARPWDYYITKIDTSEQNIVAILNSIDKIATYQVYRSGTGYDSGVDFDETQYRFVFSKDTILQKVLKDSSIIFEK